MNLMKAAVKSMIPASIVSFAAFAFAISALGQSEPSKSETPTRRLALVIGINEYSELPKLNQSVTDAWKIVDALKDKPGFKVTALMDKRSTSLKAEVADFIDSIQSGDTVVIYYAGHGIQSTGRNYILPSDFPRDVSKLVSMAIPVDELLQRVASRSPSMKLLIMDACRNNPLGTSGPPGLAQMDPTAFGVGTRIEFAAAAGQAARDGLFAKYLALELIKPGSEVDQIFRNVRLEVNSENPGQTTVSIGQMVVNFYFIPAEVADPSSALASLQRIAKEKPAGEMGQTRAVEALIANKYSLAGTGLLQGLSLKGGTFDNADFSKANLTSTDLSEAYLRQTNLEGVNLQFAMLEQATMEGSNLRNVSLAFADVSKAHFNSVKAQGSRWFAVTASDADFRGADLGGAIFMLADLRGAHFDNAVLSDAAFVGSLLEGASFAGAVFKNTDFTSSTVTPGLIKPDQLKAVCRTPWRMPLTARVMTEGYPGTGNAFRDIVRKTIFIPPAPAESLPQCMKRSLAEEGLIYGASGLEFIRDDWTASYPANVFSLGHPETQYRDTVETHLDVIQKNADSSKYLRIEFKQSVPPVQAATVPDMLRLDVDYVMLMLIRDHPEFVAKLDWKSFARFSLGMQLERGAKSSKWESYFPEGTHPDEMSSELIEGFQRWCENRSRVLPRKVTVLIQPQRKATPEGTKMSFFGIFSPYGSTKSSIEVPWEMRLDLIRIRDEMVHLGQFGLVLPSETHEWPLSQPQQAEVERRWGGPDGTPYWMPQGELLLDAESVTMDSNRVLLQSKPIRFEVKENDQTVYSLPFRPQ